MKKSRKYIMSVVLALAMVLNVFLPAGAARASAEVGAETGGTGADVTDILTNLAATVKQGNRVIPNDGTGTLTTDDISVRVSFGVPVEGDNPLPDQVVHQSDTATF